jgi:hypothetical protein
VTPLFEEMLRACVIGTPGLDIIWAGDRSGDEIFIPSGLRYTDDIVTPAREATRNFAIEGGYDKMIWQGIDALYQSREDFERLISHDLPIVSALISARTITDFACARRWVPGFGGVPTMCQNDIAPEILLKGELVWAGGPSADNIVIRSECFDIDVLGAEYIPWYKRDFPKYKEEGNSRDPNAAKGKLASSERFCYEAAKRGIQAYIDTSVKVWHVHESGAPGTNGPLARLYPDTEVPMEWVSW